MLRSILRQQWPFVAIFLGVVALYTWCALLWPLNFTSDEAIPALMAKHISEGKDIPLYFYGQSYVGSIGMILMAPFMGLFGGTPIAFRIGTIFFTLIFFILQVAVVWRGFGRTTALFNALLLTLPGLWIIMFTAVGRWSVYLALWMGIVTIYTFFPRSGKKRLLLIALAGLFTGWNAWLIISTLLGMGALGIVWGLSTPEWKRIYEAITRYVGRIPLLLIGIALAIIWPYFAWTRSYMPFAIIGLAGLLLLFISSRRKRELALSWGIFGIGTLAGYAPALYGWLALDMHPDAAYTPIIPTRESLMAILRYVVPPFMGALEKPPLLWQVAPLELFLFCSVLFIALVGCLSFAWNYRHAITRLLALSPLREADVLPMLYGILFAASWLFVLGLPNPANGSVRYLDGAWQGFSVIMAVFFAHLIQRRSAVGLFALHLWLLYFGIISMFGLREFWRSSQYSAALNIPLIESFFDTYSIRGGYADFWDAYVIDLATDERLTIVDYDRPRYIPYQNMVDGEETIAFLLRPNLTQIPAAARDLQALKEGIGRRAPWSFLLNNWDNMQEVILREPAGPWDVWIVRQRTNPSL